MIQFNTVNLRDVKNVILSLLFIKVIFFIESILMNRFFTVLLSIIFITIGCSRRMYSEDPIRRVQRYNSGGFEVQAYTDVNESNMYENLIVSGVIRLGDTNEKASNTSVNFKSEKGELIGSTVTDSDGIFKMELSTSDFSGKVEFAKG